MTRCKRNGVLISFMHNSRIANTRDIVFSCLNRNDKWRYNCIYLFYSFLYSRFVGTTKNRCFYLFFPISFTIQLNICLRLRSRRIAVRLYMFFDTLIKNCYLKVGRFYFTAFRFLQLLFWIANLFSTKEDLDGTKNKKFTTMIDDCEF